MLEHSTTVVGALDPVTLHSEDRGLVVSGSVDRESDEGQGVWTAIKSGVASFSIGFLATKSRPREGGGRDLLVIDLLEVSVVTKPMHPATRTLGWKSAETGADWEAIKAAERKAEAVHQKAQKDREVRARGRRDPRKG